MTSGYASSARDIVRGSRFWEVYLDNFKKYNDFNVKL